MMKFPESESHTLEFKGTLPKSDQVIKTVIGFCNQAGGRLILGVDNDRKIIDIDENEAMKLLEWLEHAIYQATIPPSFLKFFYRELETN